MRPLEERSDLHDHGSVSRPHVFLIHRYFAPDTPPYASILRSIALGLADNGMEVDVLTCLPSYNASVVASSSMRERIGEHVTVTRWTVLPDRSSTIAKLANLIMFGARIVGRLAKTPRVDVIMAASTPPVLIALVSSFMAKIKRARFVYHNQDIYPEVAETAGEIIPARARDLLKRLDTSTDRRADRVVVLSEDMAETITSRGVSRSSVAVINNFDPWTVSDDDPDATYDSVADTVRFVYAGNLGRFQNLEAVAGVIAALENDERFSFDFIGDGPARPWLEKFVAEHQLHRVRIHGYIAPEILADRLRSQYDVGMVSLHPGVIRCAYPSKVMSYIRNGLPVLALIEQDTELVDALARYKAGWSADPADRAAVRRTLDGLWEDRDRLVIMRDEARRMYQTEFAESGQIASWVRLFDDLVRAR